MDEQMNLNGMGINTAVNSIPAAIPVTEVPTNNTIEVTSVDTPNSSVVQNQNANINENTNTNLEANNEINFEDMDMIKELRATEEANRRKNDSIFSEMDFGPLRKYLEDDDVTDISYSNSGQLWLKTLSKGVYRVDEDNINDSLIEKIAFQCSNIMGKTFNMAHPFLDSESAELRMNFIHDSIARNGIAVVFRKTPAKIRLEKEKLMKENYVSLSIHDFLIKAVQGHCNIIMCGETGSGKTEFLKYLASHTFENEKIVTVEDTLELHLDRIYPHRDIVAMKTNNIASYSDVLVTCMRQNPIWILLSEVRSAEAVTAVRNSISSGHFILSTIHADKAANIPYRLYSLLESNIDVEQFLNTIYRYVQLGVYLRGRFDPKQGRFVREIGEVTEFYVNDENECVSNTIYNKTIKGDVTYKPISEHLLNYLEGQGIDMQVIRAANGDLEKAQQYSDDVNMSEEQKEENNEPIAEPVNEVQEEKNEAVAQQETTVQPVVENVQTEAIETPQINVSVENQAQVGESLNSVQIENQNPQLVNENIQSAPIENNVVAEQTQILPIENTIVTNVTDTTNVIPVQQVEPIAEQVAQQSIEPIVETIVQQPIEPVVETVVQPLITQQVIEPVVTETQVAQETPASAVEQEVPASAVQVDIVPTPIVMPIDEVNQNVSVDVQPNVQPVQNITPIETMDNLMNGVVFNNSNTNPAPVTSSAVVEAPIITGLPSVGQNIQPAVVQSDTIIPLTELLKNDGQNVNFTQPNITNIE